MRRLRGFKVVVLLWLIVTVGAVSPDAVQSWRERAAISDLSDRLAAGSTDTGEIAYRVLDAVAARVRPLRNGEFYRVNDRPLLRHTAWQTWTYGEGLCGEGARLILNLLRAQGIPASRVNLLNNKTGFYHVAVAYWDRGEWWLLDSVNAPGRFGKWSRKRRPTITDTVEAVMDPGGQLILTRNNPFFTRYSYFNWARVFGTAVEINQRHPFPGWVIGVIENPPLFLTLFKSAIALVVLILLYGGHRLLGRRRSRLQPA
jgi:hypothetical protein